MPPHNKRPTPIIESTGEPEVQTNVKQTNKSGRREGRRGSGKVSQGGRKASATAVESLSLLPADLVPVFCHRDPLLLGLVIRLWQRSRKDKQSLHQLHQEPWPHTEHLSLLVSVCLLLSSGLCTACQHHACTEHPPPSGRRPKTERAVRVSKAVSPTLIHCLLFKLW